LSVSGSGVPAAARVVLARWSFWTGMRLSEAIGLKWRDGDLRAGTITIRRSRVMGEENARKTNRSARAIKLHPEVIEQRRAHPLDALPQDGGR